MPVSVEFLCFRGILQNLVLAGDNGDKHGIISSGSDGSKNLLHVDVIAPSNTCLLLEL